jgi:O-antigen/teichoic acid export membrane protein
MATALRGKVRGSSHLIGTITCNLVRAISGFALTILLPPFLIDRLDGPTYNTWALVGQVMVYLTFLEFGISTAIQRFIAPEHQSGILNDQGQRYIGTAILLEVGVGIAGIVGCVVFAAALPIIYPDLPGRFVADARLGVIALGLSGALNLINQVLSGYFNGIHRNLRSSGLSAITRLLSVAFLVAFAQHGLRTMFLIILGGAIANLAFQTVVFRRRSGFTKAFLQIDGPAKLGLTKFCTPFLKWSFASFLVSGLDTAIVGHFQFQRATAYTLASGAVLVMSTLHGSALSAFVPDMSIADRARDHSAMQRSLQVASRVGGFTLMAALSGLVVVGRPVIRWWVGSNNLAGSVMPILIVLVIATSIRLLPVPFVIGLIAAGEQDRISRTAIVEGVTNLVASLILVQTIGAIGVAIGTLIGASAGTLLHSLYNMPRTRTFTFDRKMWLTQSLVKPAFLFVPVLGGYFAIVLNNFTLQALGGAVAFAGLIQLFRSNGLMSSLGKV